MKKKKSRNTRKHKKKANRNHINSIKASYRSKLITHNNFVKKIPEDWFYKENFQYNDAIAEKELAFICFSLLMLTPFLTIFITGSISFFIVLIIILSIAMLVLVVLHTPHKLPKWKAWFLQGNVLIEKNKICLTLDNVVHEIVISNIDKYQYQCFDGGRGKIKTLNILFDMKDGRKICINQSSRLSIDDVKKLQKINDSIVFILPNSFVASNTRKWTNPLTVYKNTN